MRAFDSRPDPVTPSWAAEFDAWAGEVLAGEKVDALRRLHRNRAPGARIALPTPEHFVPVIVAAGASSARPGPVKFPISGFAHGSFTRRSAQFG